MEPLYRFCGIWMPQNSRSFFLDAKFVDIKYNTQIKGKKKQMRAVNYDWKFTFDNWKLR